MCETPPCEGYKTWTDYGWEYDCGYGFGEDCDNCICITSQHGDYTGIDPTTGNVFKKD